MTDEKIDAKRLAEAMQLAWNEYCDDTGHHPSDIVQRTKTGVPVCAIRQRTPSRLGTQMMQPLTADPLAEAIARTILRHQLGCDQPAQPPAWMVAAASKIASAILPYLMDHTERDDLATEINRRTQA